MSKSELEKLIRDVWLVYERCWNLASNCNRWKINSKDEFTAALYEWQWYESNPIMKLINDKIWDTDKLYTSLYKYPKEYIDCWLVLNYISYWNHTVYVELDKDAINHRLLFQSYWYTTLINRKIVNWNYDEIEKAIDLFCETLKKKE